MKAIGAIIITIITSLFFFPFNSSLMPSINTKLALSLIGLLLYIYQGFKLRNAQINRSLLNVTMWALCVSFACLVSVIINGTSDYTYVLYVVSAWVWLSAAYVVIQMIELTYGNVSLRLVTNFLIVVCVIQCLISQLTDNDEVIANWVKSFVVSEGFMGIPDNRLYGIGCALDVAGLKFSTVLILLSYFAVHPSNRINKFAESTLYFIAFVIIGVLGAMISRTTSVGVCMAIALWFVYPIIHSKSGNSNYKYFIINVILCCFIILPLTLYLYNTNEGFHDNLRFGFEGFFSLIEKGRREVHSNDMMMSMWFWPDNWHTWLIGDGYFNNPLQSNPFYIGQSFTDNFYMGTDIGYCRLVFYGGILFLSVFIVFFVNCAYQCSINNRKCSIIFWLILAINFIGWCKVSSDIFPIYALLLWIPKSDSLEKKKILCYLHSR